VWHEPSQKRSLGSIPNAQPNDNRTIWKAPEPIHKVLIFGNNGCLLTKSIIPNHRIFGMAQPNVFEVLGLMTFGV